MDKSLKIEPLDITQTTDEYRVGRICGLSKIDMGELDKEFKNGRKHSVIEQLKRELSFGCEQC